MTVVGSVPGTAVASKSAKASLRYMGFPLPRRPCGWNSTHMSHRPPLLSQRVGMYPRLALIRRKAQLAARREPSLRHVSSGPRKDATNWQLRATHFTNRPAARLVRTARTHSSDSTPKRSIRSGRSRDASVGTRMRHKIAVSWRTSRCTASGRAVDFASLRAVSCFASCNDVPSICCALAPVAGASTRGSRGVMGTRLTGP